MRTEELLKIHEELCGRARELMKAKNHDYAGKDGDEPFANFTRVEAFRIGVDAKKGLFIRMLDKMSRIATFLSAGVLKTKGEGFQDAIIDNINYSVLLHAMVLEDARCDTTPQRLAPGSIITLPMGIDKDTIRPVCIAPHKPTPVTGCNCGECVAVRGHGWPDRKP